MDKTRLDRMVGVVTDAETKVLDAGLRWQKEMTRIGTHTLNQNTDIRRTVTPELHNAMLELCVALNELADERSGGFQQPKINVGEAMPELKEVTPRPMIIDYEDRAFDIGRYIDDNGETNHDE